MGIINSMSIGMETRSQLNPIHGQKLTNKRKREIRFHGIKRLIESKESGHLFSIKDLAEAAGYRFTNTSTDSQYFTGANFVRNLIERGVLIKINDGYLRHGKFAYEVTNKSLHGRPIKDTVKKTAIELLTQRHQESEDKKEAENKTIVNPTQEPAPSDETKSQHGGKREGAGRPEGSRNSLDNKPCYSFSFKLERKSEVVHGKETLVEVTVNETTLGKALQAIEMHVRNV